MEVMSSKERPMMNEYKKNYRFGEFLLDMITIIPFHTFFFFLVAIINSSFPTIQAIAIAEIVNRVERNYGKGLELSTILAPLIALLGMIIFKQIIPSVTNIINTSAQNHLKLNLKSRYMQKQASLPYKYMEDVDTCALIYRVCEKVEERFWAGYKIICNGVELVIKCVALILLVMQGSIMSGLAILAVSIPLFCFAHKTGKINYELQKDAIEIKRRYQYLNLILQDREYAKERSLFGYSEHFTKEFDDLCDAANQKEAVIEKKRYANMKSGSLAMVLLSVVIMLLLLPALNKGEISDGLYIGLVTSILNLVQGMSWHLSGIMQGIADLTLYLKDVGRFWSLEDKTDAMSEPMQIPGFQVETIEFKEVFFRYPGSKKYVLKNCSFVLDGKKCYAVVGKNGAGKSTLTKLLAGLYEEYEGQILINGKDLKEYTYGEVKWIFSLVFQDFARYQMSFQDNIFVGDVNEKDDERMIQIIKQMDLESCVQELPCGLENHLGKLEEGGADLSGGQWQKLAIARLLYSQAPVYILDEPTAALDPKAEARVYGMFRKINRNRCSLLITHRLGAARMADEILVLEQGRVIEQGTHRALLEIPDGLYKEMFNSQRCWYETE